MSDFQWSKGRGGGNFCQKILFCFEITENAFKNLIYLFIQVPCYDWNLLFQIPWLLCPFNVMSSWCFLLEPNLLFDTTFESWRLARALNSKC